MRKRARADKSGSFEEVQRKLADYERWFQQLDSQMRLLERERQKLSAIVTHTDAGFIVFDRDMRVAWVNDIFTGRFRAADHPAQMEGRQCHTALCRQASSCAPCPVKLTFDRAEVSHGEIRQEIEGQERHVYATAMPIKAPEGGVEQVVVMLQDVSDLEILRRSEEALRASEARFRAIFERTTAGMAGVALDGSFLQVNPAMCRFLGYEEAELLAMNVKDVTHPEDLDVTEMIFTEVGSERARSVDLEKRYLRKDGTTAWGRTSAAWIRDATGRLEFSVALVQDITERKNLEHELRQAEKMSAVGQLIAGVAHELNNPLAGVLGYAQLLLDFPMGEKVRRGLDSICREADRCRRIVHNLQTFARKHKPEVESVDINGILLSTLELRSYQLKVDDIEVVCDLGNLPASLADAHQLRQVFLNIVINAHQAMNAFRGRGVLTLRTRRHGSDIVVEVQDDGPGIDPSNLGRIFDPFFTTKDVGQGTGLGLSICYGIIREHGGRITAENAADGGAIFRVTLPLRAPERAAVDISRGPAASARSSAATSRIVVVVDEPSISDILSQALAADGHAVDTASNGTEALDRIERNRYDLIVSDLKMPGVSGQELYERIRRIDPDLASRIVFSTGDTVSIMTREFLKATGSQCVQKPFDLREFRRLVERLLAAPVS